MRSKLPEVTSSCDCEQKSQDCPGGKQGGEHPQSRISFRKPHQLDPSLQTHAHVEEISHSQQPKLNALVLGDRNW